MQFQAITAAICFCHGYRAWLRVSGCFISEILNHTFFPAPPSLPGQAVRAESCPVEAERAACRESLSYWDNTMRVSLQTPWQPVKHSEGAEGVYGSSTFSRKSHVGGHDNKELVWFEPACIHQFHTSQDTIMRKVTWRET